MRERVIEVMANVFAVEKEAITEDVALGKFKGWDSLRHMSLVLALEEEFGLRFDDDEVPNLISFKLILHALEARVG
ncbi:acyl carrier protein [Leptospira fluminis]|uniref:Acyl carrier protein n=1 Tax=Leptospira fluminis TaxID=2484979 RepID=A0A4R9GNX4_9LEPT|nr:acyl carrier protein [Leptospira fluminis]TGK17273.1 acyl carrier protein [Leptospira fluminis]